jgi:hypothetical protein
LSTQYRVTYNSNDKAFVVHREDQGKPNMEFWMHKSGLHVYHPKEANLSFVHTVTGNKEHYSQRQIKGVELARVLHATLGYPSVKDFKWAIQSNQIQDCPVTVQDVDVAHAIWGKNIASLKGKTTRKKPFHVAGDLMKVPKELLSLHKDVYLTVDLFFVNEIAFLISLSRKIEFTTSSHVANRQEKTIFAAFKPIFEFYAKRGFHISILGVDDEFAALQADIQGMP